MVNPVNNNNQEMNLKAKLTLLIGTKLISWLTILGVMIYYHLTRKYVPDGLFEITAICIIPVNSLLNPVFNSDLLQPVIKKILAFFHTSEQQNRENIELQTFDQNT